MIRAMFGAETISSFRESADTISRVAESLDTRSAELTRSATTTLDAITESLPDPVELADAIYEAKTAAQVASIAFVCVAVVSWCALAVATMALLKAGDR